MKDDGSSVKKAHIILNKNEKIFLDINPETYNVSSGANFKKTPVLGSNSEHTQFVSGASKTLSMSLNFDTYTSAQRVSDVRKLTKPLRDLVNIAGEDHHPPIVTFVFGNFIFIGMVTKADQKFTMFSREGVPIRAELAFEMCNTETEGEKKKDPKQSSDRTKVRELVEGDHLWMLSNKEYESPEHWRKIAEANNIDNPRLLKDMHKLIVPVLE